MSSIEIKEDGTIIVTARITLKPGRDDTLIDLINNAPDRGLAATIREAMRSGTGSAAIFSEDDLDLSGLGTDI